MKQVVFHLPEAWLSDRSQMLPFYRKLVKGLKRLRIEHRIEPLDRSRILTRIDSDQSFHIVNHARIGHPRALSAGVAYLYPFWHLDPDGIRAFSSIRGMKYDPGEIDSRAASRFFDRLHRRHVIDRKSRYDQPRDREVIPEGCIAVFLQDETNRIVGETTHIDRWTMLETCLAAAQDRPVVVKPHPKEISLDTMDRLVALQERWHQLQISLANIHDILGAASRVVTINSAVGVEAYMHEKPVILCGQADFHHIATEARDPVELAEALVAPPPDVDFRRYIDWYFRGQCLNAGAQDLVDQFLRRLRSRGFAS
ncbi:hypothetical protein ACRARG_01485 [Pseudooceanicola sp. C21-150M6]|uniref:capsular polysaccharide export protein, LipB/KpsS family n=1 Tax=Pseudooceanicola sp. C21-150M6 TaxID=3434355 RepID=UPI003D7FC97D